MSKSQREHFLVQSRQWDPSPSQYCHQHTLLCRPTLSCLTLPSPALSCPVLSCFTLYYSIMPFPAPHSPNTVAL
ncbi:hypothetical protein E2C01_062481 [Portunus trituberculatus]|uniref:Uncharacterized protein n=1 Tax=Portunus trituberculatus TaxID=210409 RepID=A0A5B7HDT0_PORTR|nr:hypothetical protein [Portunus trituberculatus]